MPVLLLVICFFLISVTVRKFLFNDWRSSFLAAALVWGTSLTAITEILSFFKLLSFWPVFGSWLFISILLLPLLFSSRSEKNIFLNFPSISTLSRFEIVSLSILFIMVTWIGVLAYAAPPNTWDSMTYHMSRVMHWIQNKSVAFYPTYFLPQLHQNPWSEFAIMHFQILSGGDKFANFIQWFSMIGALTGVSLLAKELHASPRGQIISVIVCATIPMGLLQGSSTQTDYVCSFWVVCFVYFGMLFKKNANSIYAIGAGTALGLCILTKATAYIFAFPFAIWFLLSTIKSRQNMKAGYIIIALLIAIAINTGHYSRNHDLYGNILGPLQEEGGYKYRNEQISVPVITSNLVRNIALHLATPIEPSNIFLEKLITRFNNEIGISTNDEIATWRGTKFYIPRISVSEDSTGNLIHVLLIFLSLYIYAFIQNKDKTINQYLVCWLIGALLFSAILKWQPWNSRLQLPFFVLGSPFIGLILSRLENHKIARINYANIIIAVLLITSTPWLLMSFTKPVFRSGTSIFTESRIDQYFAANKAPEASYIQAVNILNKFDCSNIGLYVGSHSSFYEYPFWTLLLEHRPPNMVQISNLNVHNISRHKYNEYVTTAPCAVVMIDTATTPYITINNMTYTREWSSNSIAVLKPIQKQPLLEPVIHLQTLPTVN